MQRKTTGLGEKATAINAKVALGVLTKKFISHSNKSNKSMCEEAGYRLLSAYILKIGIPREYMRYVRVTNVIN